MTTVKSFRWFNLTPCDAWFFRDGRPMNRGEDARGVESLFPPLPPTVVGAVRAALARSRGWDGRREWKAEWKEVLGDGYADLGQLAFAGPLLALDGKPLFPFPRHILVDADSKAPRGWLEPSQEQIRCDIGDVVLPLPPPRIEGQTALTEAPATYLTSKGFAKVAQGQLPDSSECIPANALFQFEPRVGIARVEETRAVEEGGLYNPTFVRLKKRSSLILGLSGLPKEWSLPQLFPLGGESRMAHCQAMEIDPLNGLGSVDGSLLISISPVLMTVNEDWHGPRPGETARSLHQDLGTRVKTVAMERPVRIPGWDSLQGQPLAQLNAIPPGTVWWLDAPIGSSGDGAIWGLGDRCSHGYGLAVSAAPPKQHAKGKV